MSRRNASSKSSGTPLECTGTGSHKPVSLGTLEVSAGGIDLSRLRTRDVFLAPASPDALATPEDLDPGQWGEGDRQEDPHATAVFACRTCGGVYQLRLRALSQLAGKTARVDLSQLPDASLS